jgi:NAD(P)-dependent dehydrogenase (short-subunit alcohol dehydrogenase family)
MQPAQKVALITGADGGLGRATAVQLARRGVELLLASRDAKKGQQLAEDIANIHPGAKITSLALDLGNLSSVKRVANLVIEQVPRLDWLINNAGVFIPPLTFTDNGFESQFGINHLGHFALTVGLQEKLSQAHSCRVITVSSSVHRFAQINWQNLNAEKHYSRWHAYAVSKLANLLFTHALQTRLPGQSLAFAVHPGYVATAITRHLALGSLGNKIFGQSPDQAIAGILRACEDEDLAPASYIGPAGLIGLRGTAEILKPSRHTLNPELAEKLWQHSEQLTNFHWS